MKKIFLALVLSSFVLSSCSLTSKPATNQVVEEGGVATKIGEITIKSGDEWLLKTETEIVNLASNKVNLDNYLKKKVKVSGMYSGTTLYVDEIEIN